MPRAAEKGRPDGEIPHNTFQCCLGGGDEVNRSAVGGLPRSALLKATLYWARSLASMSKAWALHGQEAFSSAWQGWDAALGLKASYLPQSHGHGMGMACLRTARWAK